jgi:hypothetical protein
VLKYLFVLALFALVIFILYWRMRPYIRGVRRFLGVVREANRMRAGAPTDNMSRQSSAPRRTAGEKLARCASCGTWMPSSRAVKLGGTTYCSHACMERAADSPRRQRKSAS